MDLVQVSLIEASLAQFGERFIQRVFTTREHDDANASPALRSQRLAARFAAKEAALKALALADQGIGWRELEVLKHPDGRCELSLHGKAAAFAAQRGVAQTALSLSHEGDFAVAIVVAVYRALDPALSGQGDGVDAD
jgi:holo-[acyl-carrier protein] synthase